MDAQLMGQGFEVMIFGLGGVFAVLILFYAATKIMLGFAKKASKKDK